MKKEVASSMIKKNIMPVNQLGMFENIMNDPTGLMEGSGKSLRHVKIRSREDVKNPALKKLLKEASVHLPRLKK